MDGSQRDARLITLLRDMRERLDRACSIGMAAQACGDSGNIAKAVEIALDVEQVLYEVNTLLNAASLIHRIKADRR
jgi:peptide deformylase